MKMKLLTRGAEASVYLGEWFGQEAVFKIREPKQYRHPALDSKIRRLRTLHEASFIAEARRLGVATPLIYFVDQERGEIVMQFLHGRRLKEIIDCDGAEVVERWCREVGRYAARLHLGRVIHGDLTTSNFIAVGDRLALIDFGLAFYSTRLEDRAVDLHLLDTLAESAHHRVAGTVSQAVLEGYREVMGEAEAEKVLKQLKEVERRGRYKKQVD
ncbi:MAG: Kae1-associated kinase Bud32 [Thaumarchaeota archaeon]|nr:Kae1-associated kinase Bud32 [Nitrososphaerota archaeon]MCL5317953.1 Kae1-associated kinase Bud32 [Nitrososphaerota archaeon]